MDARYRVLDTYNRLKILQSLVIEQIVYEYKTNGRFPTRLVIPATNFTAIFLKLGYPDIKAILDKNKMNYNRFTITQASDLKEKLEKLKIKEDVNTLASLDIENMYTSIRISLIKKAITFYACHLRMETGKKINECLKMNEFGIQSYLITFDGKHYKYKGGQNKLDKGLVIGD